MFELWAGQHKSWQTLRDAALCLDVHAHAGSLGSVLIFGCRVKGSSCPGFTLGLGLRSQVRVKVQAMVQLQVADCFSLLSLLIKSAVVQLLSLAKGILLLKTVHARTL